MTDLADAKPRADYSVAQIEAGIDAALKDRNMEAVVGLLHLLAVKAPDRAQLHLDAIAVAKALGTGSKDTT